jgi:hypothetical protein
VHTVVGDLVESQGPAQRNRLAGSVRLRAHPFRERGTEVTAASSGSKANVDDRKCRGSTFQDHLRLLASLNAGCVKQYRSI